MQELALTSVKLEDFPPKLKKLAKFIEENYAFKSLKEACELAGLNYKSTTVMMTKERKKGRDFNDLLYSLLDKRNKDRLVFVDDTVYDKALTGDTRAAELFYKRTGEIKPVNRTEITFNQQNNYLTMQGLEADILPEPEDEIEYAELQELE